MTIEFNGTGGLMEGDFGTADIDVNLDFALDFPGTDEYISIPDHDDLSFGNGSADSVLTISAWVYQDTAAFFPVVAKGGYNQSNGEYLLSVSSSGHLQFEMYDESESSTYIGRRDATDMGQGVWNHIAVTYDATEADTGINLYLNGVLVDDTDNSSGSYTAMENLGAVVKIGAAKTSGIYTDGKIADVRIYAEELSLANIQVLASSINGDNTLGAGTTNLKGHWKLNESTIDDLDVGSVLDSSGNSHHGQCVGWDNDAAVEASRIHDAFSVNVQDTATTTGTTTVTQGKLECLTMNSVKLDGSGDYVEVADAASLDGMDALTISAWVNCSTDGSDTIRIVDKNHITAYNLSASRSSNDWFYFYINGVTMNSGTGTVNFGTWQHVVMTYDSTGSGTGRIYIDGVLINEDTSFSGSAVGNSSDPLIIGGNYTKDGNYWIGKLRDIKMFKQALSADQVASLYSGSYNVTPAHWWKVDDVWGQTTVADTGTGTASDGTTTGNASVGGAAHTHTLDLDGTLTIAANGTLSAPRGDMTLAGTTATFDNYGTFTHNNGTVKLDNGADVAQIINDTASVDPVFYNLTHHRAANSYHMYLEEDTTVEGTFTNTAGYMNLRATKKLTLGTDTSSGTYTAGWSSGGIRPAGTSDTTVYIYGKNQLYPATIGGNSNAIDWNNEAPNTQVNIKWINFTADTETGGSGTLVTLDGDCEFDALTVSSGDTLDLNGQRAEFSGSLLNSGTMDIDGMLVCIGDVDLDVSATANSNKDKATIIYRNTSNKDTDLPNGTYGTLAMLGTNEVEMLTASDLGTTPIIIGGGASAPIDFKNNITCGDFTVATGGVFDASGDTLTVAGDFTTSGGLLGPSCLTLNGSDEYAYNSGQDWLFTNEFTIEMWFKSSTDADMTLLDIRDDAADDEENRIHIFTLASANEIRFVRYDQHGSTGSGSTTTAGATFHDGKWHHLAVVCHPTTGAKIYYDGKLNKTNSHTLTRASGQTLRMHVGRRSSDAAAGDGGYFNGSIEELRLFQDERTVSEIRSNMFVNVHGDISGDNLVARYGFNEGSGSDVDNSQGTGGRDLSLRDGSGTVTDLWAGAGDFDGSDADCILKMANTTFTDATCDTNGTTTVTCDSSSSIEVGHNVSGSGIPIATSVIAVNSAGSVTSFTLSQAATSSLTNTTLTFNGAHINYTGDEAIGHLHIDAGQTTLNEITGVGTDTFSCASVWIDAGTTFTTTSGTTTITSEKDHTGQGYGWRNDGGTFTHNNGLVKFDTPANTIIKENTWYDFELYADGSSRQYEIRDVSGDEITFLGNLTLTAGRLKTTSSTDTITVHGNTYITSSAKCWHNAHQDTNKITHHGLVTNKGEFKINDGTTVKLNGGIRQLGTLTIT